MEPTYSDRIVAFIDILGFAALVRRLGKEPTLQSKLHHALGRIRVYKESSTRGETVQSKLQVSVFSDSIVISGEPDDIHSVIWSVIHLQCDLLAMGILVRGGISRGPTVHTGEILYGEGMLDAHYLESKAAIYPRIIIDPKILDTLEPGQKALFMAQDVDGLWFIDPFAIGILPTNSESLLEDGYDPHEESLKYLGRKIDKELSLLSDVGHIAKWNWLKSRLAVAILEFARLGRPRFWYVMHEAEKQKSGTPSAPTTTSDGV